MLDNISALLNSGCSVMLACKEVGIAACQPQHQHPFSLTNIRRLVYLARRITASPSATSTQRPHPPTAGVTSRDTHYNLLHYKKLEITSKYIDFCSELPTTVRFLEVAKKSSPCSAESRSPQSTLKQKPPVPNVHASGAHPSSLLKNCVNNTDSELPGLTPSNVSLLPPRLRNHFMSVMHQKVKEHVR
jgi:hypothetical protein